MSIERPTDKLKWLIGEWRKTAASEGGMNGLGIGFEFCANEAEVLSFALEFQVSEQDAELTRLRGIEAAAREVCEAWNDYDACELGEGLFFSRLEVLQVALRRLGEVMK